MTRSPAGYSQACVSGFGPKAIDVAEPIGDGCPNTAPDPAMVRDFKDRSGGKPAPAGAEVAYAPTSEEGWQHHRLGPNAGVPGELAQVLPTPVPFEQTSSSPWTSTRESVVAGPDRDAHLEQIEASGRRATTTSTSPTRGRTVAR